MLAQSRPTPTGISVRDVVGYGRHAYRGRWRAADPDGPAAVEDAMRTTGVADLAGRCVDELSGGQLQRVWLACCLAQQTGVLLLEEGRVCADGAPADVLTSELLSRAYGIRVEVDMDASTGRLRTRPAGRPALHAYCRCSRHRPGVLTNPPLPSRGQP